MRLLGLLCCAGPAVLRWACCALSSCGESGPMTPDMLISSAAAPGSLASRS